ncbi:MAG: hypothetical protein ACLPYS_02590 [Vulcanimicrobiaceae bacterium]
MNYLDQSAPPPASLNGARPARPAIQKDRLFPKYAIDYFDQLRKQYTLLLEATKAQPPQVVTDLFRQEERGSATWADIFALETARLYGIPDDQLAMEVLRFRSRFSARSCGCIRRPGSSDAVR